MIKKVYSGKIKSILKIIILEDILPNINNNGGDDNTYRLMELESAVDKPILVQGLTVPTNFYNLEHIYIERKKHKELFLMLEDIIHVNSTITRLNTNTLTLLVDRVLIVLNEIAVCGKSPINISLTLPEYKDLRKYIKNKYLRKKVK